MKSILALCAAIFCSVSHGEECPPKPCPWGVNAPAAIFLNPCAQNIFIDASFLYWQAREEGLCAGIAQSSLLAPSGSIGGFLVEQPFRYKPAFQVGVKFQTPFDAWDFTFNYTWYHHGISQFTARPSPDGSIAPLWIILEASALTSRAHWHLAMDIVDMEAGRSEWVGKDLAFRPHADLRFVSVAQKYDVDYAIYPDGHNFSNNETKSWGIGPRVGLESSWKLGYGLRMEGDAAFSLLWQRFHGTSVQFAVPAVEEGSLFNPYAFNVRESYLRPVLELALGMGWSRLYCCDRFQTDFSAEYIMSTWWNQNMMWVFLNEFGINAHGSPRSNLYLHGLTLSASFGF